MSSAADQLALPGFRSGTWTVDPQRSRIAFQLWQFGSRLKGRFTAYDAIIFTGKEPADSGVEVSIDIASIDTRNARRDDHLRRSYLDLQAHPTATYRSSHLRRTEQGLVVDGILTLNGISKDVPLALRPHGFTTDADGTRTEFGAIAHIRRRDFHITAPLGGGGLLVSDKITIHLDIHATLRPSHGGAS